MKKRFVQCIPEIFFVGVGVFWVLENYQGTKHINYIAILVVVLLLVQLLFQKRIPGLVLGVVLGVFSIYMMLAVLSEFYEFESFSNEAFQLLIVGMGLCWVGLTMAAGMVYKFVVLNPKKDKSENYMIG